MMTKKAEQRQAIQMIDVESVVPAEHLVRKIEAVLDFEFVRELVKDLYSEEKGRPSIDPVVLIKIVFIQFMFGIRSMRQTIKDIEVNVAYHWFLGYGFTDPILHFSTFGKNYVRRFADNHLFEQIFQTILSHLIEHGFVKEETVFAAANLKKLALFVAKTKKEIARISTSISIFFHKMADQIRKKTKIDLRNLFLGSILSTV